MDAAIPFSGDLNLRYYDMKILIIEDEILLADSLRAMLEGK